MAAKQDKGADEPSFDERLERLESIVAQLEEGGLGLEDAIERYQQGIELLKGCHATLEGYAKQVEELTRGAEEALAPFADDPDARA
jgi:exodeoxyribonuclease VII small subunit